MNTYQITRIRTGLLVVALGLSYVLATLTTAHATRPEGRAISIDRTGADVSLRWLGIAEALYGVQARASLTQGDWSPLATVTGIDGETVYPVSPDLSPSRFFRVFFPQPTVVAGEPAFASADGGTVYISGQFFYAGDQIRIGGVVLTGVVFQSPTLLSATLPPLPPGLYGIEVLSGSSGGVLATLPEAIEVAPPLSHTLQEPPEWPPAGPRADGKKGLNAVNVKLALFDDTEGRENHSFLSKKGYDYYQAQSAFASASLPVQNDGHVTVLKGQARGDGHVTVLKARASGNGHVTVLKSRDDDCDGLTASARGHGHVTVLKGHDQDCDGDVDIRLHSGELQQQITDLSLPGRGLDFVWTRTYRSRTGPDSPQGTRWTHGYDVRCAQSGADVAITDGTGRTDTFRLQSDGTYTCPGFFREGSFTGGVFRLTFADTGFWEFRPLDTTPASGRLARIQDRNGNAMTCDYDGSDRLTQVTDTLGRGHVLQYTPAGRVASVTDSTGRAVTYSYYAQGETGGSPGDLKSVTSPPVTGTPNGNDFPAGKTVAYTYTSGQADDRANHLLLAVTDALGQTVLQCAYDLTPSSSTFQRCVSARRDTHSKLCLSYVSETPTPNNRFASLRCLVNDPVGNVSELAFDLRNRCVAVREYTGRATPDLPVTDTENRPAAKLRDTDPDVFETVLRWNRDSLCLGGALPGGAVISCAYEADLNPSTRARKRGDLRTFRQRAAPGRGTDSDGDGVPDLTEITRSFTYDSRFGDDPSRKGWDGSVKGKRFGFGGETSPETPLGRSIRKGWDGTVKGGNIDHRDDDCDGDRFVASATDPLGNTATAEYDAHGNCTRIVTPFTEVTDPPTTWSVAYDTHGQPIEITHPTDAAGRGRKDMLTWWQGRAASIMADGGPGGLALTTTFEYDTRGNVTRCVDPRGNDVLITHNALNQRMSIARQTQGATFGERVKSSFSYDANDNLVGVVTDNRHPDGRFVASNPTWETVIAYDALHRPTLFAHELSHTVQQRSVMTNQFAYDANDRLVLHRLPEAVSGAEPDNVIACAYDERGLLFREERAPGTGLCTADTFDYDTNGNLRRVSKIDSFTIKQSVYSYDGFDRCVKVADAMGNLATRCCDANGNLTYERADGETTDQPGNKGNRKLAETRYTYDTRNRLVGRIDSFFDVFTELAIGDGKGETAWTYAPNGQLMSATDDNGATSTFAYDRAGRLASVTDSKGNASAYAYDPNGNLLASTQTDLSDVSAGEQVFVRTFTYDTLNRCVGASDNVGNAVTYAYDSCDRVASETDPSGNETAYAYDGLGRITGTAHYVGAKERGITINTSHVEYRNKRLASTTDSNGNTTEFAYDACDRQTGVTHADGSSESLVWSPRSNLDRRTDANGTTVTNTYDLCDRLIRRDIAAPEGVMATTTFESFSHDGLGRLVAAVNDTSSLAYAYDSLGNRVSSTQDGFASTSTFDGVGNRRTCSSPSGYVVSTTFDALNRPLAVSLQAPSAGEPATLATFAYDGPDRLARVARASGINTRVFWNGQQNVPNAAGDFGWQQVARVNHARAGGGQVVDQRVSAYDRSQNKVLRAMTAPWSSGGALVTNVFGYDKLHRLTRSRKSGSVVAADFDYVLDANGNRLQVTNNGITESYTMDAALPAPADFQMNQYTDTPFGTDGYDARGNRVIRASSTRSTFTHFDYADRLVQVDALDPSDPVGSPVTVATFSYDALGRRIGKTVFGSGGLPSVTTTYVYDDGKDDDCNGSPDDDVLETYVNDALSRVSVLAGGAGGGAAAASYAATGFILAPPLVLVSAAGEMAYTHCDDIGNVLALTDAAGNVIEHYDYDDFGAPRFFDAAGVPQANSAVGNDLLFRGLRWDAETGLYSGSRRSSLRSDMQSASAQNNPYFKPSTLAGDMPDTRSSRGGGTTWHECFITSYGLAAGGGGGGMWNDWDECFISYAMDPGTGQTLGRTGSLACGGQSSRAFADNNPWTGEPVAMKKGTVKFFNDAKGFGFLKEEGGRHTPFHNKYRPESAFRSVSNVLKTKHDTAKNSVGNIR